MSAGTLSLSFSKSGDRRKPVTVQVVVQDDECDDVVRLELDEHQWALLMSGSVIAVNYDSEVIDDLVQKATRS